MEQYLKNLIESLLSEPQKLVITKSTDEMGILLSVEVAPADMGRIIGKEGNTIKAIRTIIHVLGSQTKAIVSVKIVEPQGSNYSNRREKTL